jgi:ABC-type transport system substrate-binding protein
MEESNYGTRLNNRKVSRRALLGGTGTLALGGAAAMIVGCDSGGGGNDLGTGETPKPIPSPPTIGGTVTQGRLLAALGIDPHIDLTGLDIDLHIYPYLYGWKPGAEEAIFNNLAESLEIVDDVTFNFKLKPGFINSETGGGKPNPAAGEEITSTDVKQSFIRRGTSITAPDKRFPRKIAGSTDPAALEAALITPDPYTFQFTMADPFVPAVRDMANPTWGIVSAKVLDEYLYLSQDAFGAGPFQLEEFRGNERIVVSRNPNYKLKDRPRLDGKTWIVITEPSSLYSAFRQGQHDINGSVLYRDDYDELSGDSDFRTASTPSLFYPVVHVKIKAPFDDVRVREALNISMNRDEVMAVIWKGEGEYNGPIQWPQTKWALPQEEIREFYKYDPERAKELLADAGYEGGFTTRLKLPKVSGATFIADTAVLLKEQWSRVGINVEIDEVELGAYIGNTLLPGNFELTFFPNLPYDEPDRPLSFYHSLGVTGSGNWCNYTNPDLDALINAQSEEFDQAKRQQIIYDAQRMILTEHGPQLTITGAIQYSARWHYVHLPYEIGQDPGDDVSPFGVDDWTEKV